MENTHTVCNAYAEAGRGRAHCVEAGRGPPLMLLAETARTQRRFSRIEPGLARRAFRVPTTAIGLTAPEEMHMGPQVERIAAIQTEAGAVARAVVPFLSWQRWDAA